LTSLTAPAYDHFTSHRSAYHKTHPPFPTRRSSDLHAEAVHYRLNALHRVDFRDDHVRAQALRAHGHAAPAPAVAGNHHLLSGKRSEEHTSELQSRGHLVCRLQLEKKKQIYKHNRNQ